MRLTWPLPAIAVWGLGWASYSLLVRWGVVTEIAIAASSTLGIVASALGDRLWHRWMMGLGFPVSLLLAQAASLPGWVWLLPLLVLMLIYPLNAWRDAPLFPTPRDALNELPALVLLEQDAIILDAGCGLGDGLKALHNAFPQARLVGIEWSWPLRALCALRCPWASVRQGDIWQADWSGFDLVYLFQRPESMPHAVAKARAEMKPGSWLVSLEFEAHALEPVAMLNRETGKPVWVYRMPLH
jgi:SAM-dependent methyltransferase